MPARDIRVLCHLPRPLAGRRPDDGLDRSCIETLGAEGNAAKSFDQAETDTHGRA